MTSIPDPHPASPFPASLRRLIASSRRPRPIGIWNALTPNEKIAAARACLGAGPADAGLVLKAVAEGLNFRFATVKKWSPDKAARELPRVPVRDLGTAMVLLRRLHDPGRIPMIASFLDALGVAHDEGRVEEYRGVVADRDSLRVAAQAMYENHGPRLTAVYLLYLHMSGAPAGDEALSWLRDVDEGTIDASGAAAAGETSADDRQATSTPGAAPGPSAETGVAAVGEPLVSSSRPSTPEPTSPGQTEIPSPISEETARPGPSPDKAGTPTPDPTEAPSLPIRSASSRPGAPRMEEEGGHEPASDTEPSRRDPSRLRSFTTLDVLLKRAAIAVSRDIHGALTEDQLDDVVDELLKLRFTEDELDDAVDELVHLNATRHQSFFHAGFRDVVLERTMPEEPPADYPAGLRWYWTGAVQGWERRNQWPEIVEAFQHEKIVRELGDGNDSASLEAVQHVVRALRETGNTDEIAGFVKPRTIEQEPALFEPVLEAATAVQREGNPESARRIFELLMNVDPEIGDAGQHQLERLRLDARRRMAHCLRHLHYHDRARTLLTNLLDTERDPDVRAMVHADLGIMAGGFDGLEEVVLPPTRSELDGVLTRLERGKDHFFKSSNLQARYSAHGRYCLGVLALGRAVEDGTFEDAERHLQRARNHFSEGGASYANDLRHHANLYFGIARAQEISADKLAHAADVITRALAAGARIPRYLIVPTTEAFGLEGVEGDLKRVTNAIADTGDSALDELVEYDPGLGLYPWLAERLRLRAETKGRPPKDRARDLRSAFHGFLQQGNSEAAGEVLDRLERLARDNVATSDFLDLLDDQLVFDAWDHEDVIVACARLHENRGEYENAVSVLESLFHRLATDGKMADAAGLLARIRDYGIDPGFYSSMRDRYEALSAQMAEAAEPSTSEAPAPVTILVVGAELQSGDQAVVRSQLRDRHKGISVDFVPTGWSQNWQRPYSDIKSRMEKCDALVIQRFMRTHLGRAIRRACTVPWRSCYGSKPGVICNTVLEAAAAARQS